MIVRDAMTKDPITCPAGAPLRDAVTLMKKNHIGGLPVMDGDELVGILTVRQPEYLDPKILLQKKIERPLRCGKACRIGVVAHDYFASVTTQQLDLLGSQAGAERSNKVLDTVLKGHNKIHVAFDQYGEV